MLGSTGKRTSKFVVYQRSSGWHFKLVATNGETVATSEPYSSKDAAVRGCDAVKRAANDAEVVIEEDK